MKVLIVFANPRGTSSLRLGQEDKTIHECIERSKFRHKIDLTVKHAVTVDDIRRALLDTEYDIVHFSGHGTGHGLAFENSAGGLYVPPMDAVAALLKEFTPPLQCVLLNACYSTRQAAMTSLGLPFTIAMEGPIGDSAAIVFSGGFYDSIGAGKDIEFSFRQGVHALRLAGYSDCVVPQLLRLGECGPGSDLQVGRASEDAIKRGSVQPLLVGFGLDVSGSMEASINNRVGTRQTRLQGFRSALAQGVARSREIARNSRQVDVETRIFAYAFGLRTGDVCDLLSLVKCADDIISKEEIEDMKQRYSREIQARYAGGGGLASLARSYGLGGIVDSVERTARANAETEVRNRILAEVQRRLSAKLLTVGETTLDLDELAELWEDSAGRLEDAEGLIFGGTPMCEALRKLHRRFGHERERWTESMPVLLLITDGDPTDGDPEPLADGIKAQGIALISGYITDRDVGSPKTLVGKPDPTWPEGARRLFRMSSPVDENSPFLGHLLREGWTIEPNAKSFVQANHSETLEQLVGLVLSPTEQGCGLLPKGR